jgi:hypothetical protein
MLEACKDRSLLKARARQRTDSTHILAATRDLNRLELVGETLRATLNALATVAPQWLRERVPPEWFDRYAARVEETRLPKGQEDDLTNNFMAQVIGRKRVLIVPSWDIPMMANDYHVYSRVDGRVTPPAPRPGRDAPQVMECVLHPGEILFLPVGSLHHVEGIDVSSTMSFTNFLFDNDFASFYTTYHGV